MVGGGNEKKPTNKPYSSLVGGRGWHHWWKTPMSHKTRWWLVGPASCMAMKGGPTHEPYSLLVGAWWVVAIKKSPPMSCKAHWQVEGASVVGGRHKQVIRLVGGWRGWCRAWQ